MKKARQFEKKLKLKHNINTMEKRSLGVLLIFACVFTIVLVAAPNIQASSSGTNNQNSVDNNATVDQFQKYCPINGIGHLLCPLIDLLSMGADFGYDALDDQLKLNTSLIKTSSSSEPAGAPSAVMTIWGNFRNIANVFLIFVILLMVFSHVTSYGFSNYQVKTMLPKLIVAALLINLSMYITQVVIDFSNIIGAWLKGMFDSFAGSVPSSSEQGAGLNIAGIIASVFTAIAANRMVALTSFIIPILVTIVVMIVTAALLLYVRQAVMILVVVLSPIAFASNILPNTKKAFDLWKSSLLAICMVYISVAALFGAGNLVGRIIAETGRGNIVLELLAAAMNVLPIAFVPSLLQQSMNKIPLIGQQVSSLANKINQGAWNKTNKSSLSQGIRNKWGINRENRRARAINSSESRFRRLWASPLTLAKQALPGMRHGNAAILNQQEQYIQNMTNQLTLADAIEISNAAMAGREINRNALSTQAQAQLATHGQRSGLIEMAAASLMSKQNDTNPEDYDRLISRAQQKGAHNDLIRNLDDRSNTASAGIGNLAMQAYLADKRRTGDTTLAMHAHADRVYSNYINTLNPSTLASASVESLQLMEDQLRQARATSPSFAAAIRNMQNGTIPASTDVVNFLTSL